MGCHCVQGGRKRLALSEEESCQGGARLERHLRRAKNRCKHHTHTTKNTKEKEIKAFNRMTMEMFLDEEGGSKSENDNKK